MDINWNKMTNSELATKIKLVEIEFSAKKNKIIKMLDELNYLENEFNKGQETLKKRINP